MSVSKDEKTGKWTVQCYYENWKGEKKHKKKRGFTTKKEALEWERDFLRSTSADLEMTLGAFVDIYFRDKAGELKDRTIKNKRYMIEVHILPYFANKRMNEITPALQPVTPDRFSFSWGPRCALVTTAPSTLWPECP